MEVRFERASASCVVAGPTPKRDILLTVGSLATLLRTNWSLAVYKTPAEELQESRSCLHRSKHFGLLYV